ncbi:MAG: YqaA family protein [Thermoflexales bacterium]
MAQVDSSRQATIRAASLKKPIDRRALISLALALLISVAVIVITSQFREVLTTLRGLGLFGVFALSFLGNATVLVPAPAFVIACASGPMYGILSTGLVAGLGSSLGEATGYLAGYGGGAFLPHGKTYEQLHQLMKRFGGWVIFVLSLLPNPFFDIGGTIAGALKMPVGVFFLSTLGGKLVRMIIIAWACASGLQWIEGIMR